MIKNHAYELLTRLEVNNMLTNLKKTNEAIVNDTVPGIIFFTELMMAFSIRASTLMTFSWPASAP